MQEGEIIYKDEDYFIVRKTSFSDELIEVFDTTSWGETGALYEHKDSRKRLEELENPILLEVRNDRDLIGCCVLVGRTTYLDNKSYETYFARYLVANPKFRGKGLMTRYAIHTMDKVREKALSGTLYVGTVEKFNKKSYHLVSTVEYEDVSTIKTTAFSRAFPKTDPRVKKVETDSERERITKLLLKQYQHHSLFHLENIFREDGYYYLKEGDDIIAGVQCFPALWVIKKLPGWTGSIIMRLSPHIPILNKMFNPKKFEFLAFEGIIYKENRVKDLHRLFQHVLADQGFKTALFWPDERSALYRDLMSYGKLGILQKAGAASDATIMISFTDIPEDEKISFKGHPTYQSGFDFI